MEKNNKTHLYLGDTPVNIRDINEDIDEIFLEGFSNIRGIKKEDIDKGDINFTKDEVDKIIKTKIQNRDFPYFYLLVNRPPVMLPELGSKIKLAVKLSHYCIGRFFTHKEINTTMWDQIPEKLSNPLVIIEDEGKTGVNNTQKVYDIFLDLKVDKKNRILCAVRDELNKNNEHSLFLDSAYGKLPDVEDEKANSKVIPKKKNKEQYKSVLSQYLYEAITYDNFNEIQITDDNSNNEVNKKRRIKYLNPEKITEIAEICFLEKINQLSLKGIENPKYVIDTCEKIYDELSKEFKRWVNKFQDIVLNLPEFQYRKEEIREYFSFISSVPKYYSDKIDRKAWTILDEIVPKKIEVADILAQPFTESGPRKPPNEEDDDENEGK